MDHRYVWPSHVHDKGRAEEVNENGWAMNCKPIIMNDDNTYSVVDWCDLKRDNKRQKIKRVITYMIAIGIIQIALFYAVYYTTSLPVVYRSWITKECVSVGSIQGYTCVDLPKQYINLWIQ